MEKITKEELMEELKTAGLSDEQMAEAAGGTSNLDYYLKCVSDCASPYNEDPDCIEKCKKKYGR